MKNKNKFKIKDVIYFGKYRVILTEEREKDDIMYYYYLQNMEYGIISMQFGMSKKSIKYTEFKEIVFGSVDEYIQTYKEEYED